VKNCKLVKNSKITVSQLNCKLAYRMEFLLRSPDLCPIVANDLCGLAPALICTAGIDILRDEGIHYAHRLRQFDVPVEWKHYEGRRYR
jgi:acetyl esterase/lipase